MRNEKHSKEGQTNTGPRKTTRPTKCVLDLVTQEIVDTVIESILIVFIVLSVGLVLLLFRKGDTSRSKIHGWFHYFDSFMYDPSLDRIQH